MSSRYVADARAQVLPLVGGGEHDWAALLGNWGVLQRDLAYAATLRHLAWIGILACCAWLVWRWFQDSRG